MTRQTVVMTSLLTLMAACGGAESQEAATPPAEAVDAPRTEAPRTEAPRTEAMATGDPHSAEAHAQTDPLPPLPGDVLEGAFLGTDGQEVGTVMLTETPNGLLLRLDVSEVAHGFHGVHLHETGRCEAAEGFSTAGGHANPSGAEHGYLVTGGPHVGDLPNAYAHREGHIRTDLFKAGARLSDVQDADGFAVMIHSGADDYESQPSGDAGSRVACAAFPG